MNNIDPIKNKLKRLSATGPDKKKKKETVIQKIRYTVLEWMVRGITYLVNKFSKHCPECGGEMILYSFSSGRYDCTECGYHEYVM